MEVFIGRVECECPFCGAVTSINVRPNKETTDYFRGVLLAQEAFGYLTETEREAIISGICPDCQEEIF